MVHISPWDATIGLITGAAATLPPGSPLYLYGPYRRKGVASRPHSAEFHVDGAPTKRRRRSSNTRNAGRQRPRARVGKTSGWARPRRRSASKGWQPKNCGRDDGGAENGAIDPSDRDGTGRKRRPARIGQPTLSGRPLLVIDGDSFAHRSCHALPKTIRRSDGKGAGAILGFANVLLRFYADERPRAVIVGWDTLEATTKRHDSNRIKGRGSTPHIRNRARWTWGKRQPWKRKFAARDFRQDASAIAPENRPGLYRPVLGEASY
jgi:hypothetical protein